MVKIMENPIKHGMIWGVLPLFLGNTHMNTTKKNQPSVAKYTMTMDPKRVLIG